MLTAGKAEVSCWTSFLSADFGSKSSTLLRVLSLVFSDPVKGIKISQTVGDITRLHISFCD